MKSVYDKEENCSGCTACYSICPVSAITMLEDEKGFKYPNIDQEKCINCKMCSNVCPLKKQLEKKSGQKVFALKNNDEQIRINSSSGGFFTEVAKNIIENDGVVFGAVFDKEYNVIHKKIDSVEQINKMRGSKYVQSELGQVFKEIEKLLKSGKKVLFSGTPCQVLGLIQFLGKEYYNLFTCDFVCHGVPSPKIFNDYKKIMETKYKSKIDSINFRYKHKNSINYIKVVFNNKRKHIKSCNRDEFYFLFLKNYILRESCYNCHFSNTNRIADITMGDFWGIKETIKNFDDGKGVSLVIVNSKKGLELYNNIKNKFYYKESDINSCLQPNLKHSTIKPDEAEIFWNTYKNKGYKKSVSKIKKIYFINRVKNKVNKLNKLRRV